MRTKPLAPGYRWNRCSQCGRETQTPKRFGIYDLMTLLCSECHDGPLRIMAIQNAVFDGKDQESAKRKLGRWAEATARQQAERILDTKFYDNTRGAGPDFISTTSGIKVGLEVTAIMPVNIQARLRTDGLSPMEDMSRVVPEKYDIGPEGWDDLYRQVLNKAKDKHVKGQLTGYRRRYLWIQALHMRFDYLTEHLFAGNTPVEEELRFRKLVHHFDLDDLFIGSTAGTYRCGYGHWHGVGAVLP